MSLFESNVFEVFLTLEALFEGPAASLDDLDGRHELLSCGRFEVQLLGRRGPAGRAAHPLSQKE